MLPLPNLPKDYVAIVIFGHQVSQYETILVDHSYSALTQKYVTRIEVSDKTAGSNGTASTVQAHKVSVSDYVTQVPVKYKYLDNINLDAYHAGCIQTALVKSKQFCKGFLQYIKRKNIVHKKRGICTKESATQEVSVLRLVMVHLLPTHKEWIDYKW